MFVKKMLTLSLIFGFFVDAVGAPVKVLVNIMGHDQNWHVEFTERQGVKSFVTKITPPHVLEATDNDERVDVLCKNGEYRGGIKKAGENKVLALDPTTAKKFYDKFEEIWNRSNRNSYCIIC
jgi:hypothetical protein